MDLDKDKLDSLKERVSSASELIEAMEEGASNDVLCDLLNIADLLQEGADIANFIFDEIANKEADNVNRS